MQAISAKGQARYAQQQEEATKRGEVELQQRPAMAEANAKAQALALEQQRLTLQAQQAQQAANVQMETQQQLQQAILQMQQRQVVPQYPQVVSAGWLNIRFTTYCKGCNRMIYNQLCWRRVRFCPHCGVELDKPI